MRQRAQSSNVSCLCSNSTGMNSTSTPAAGQQSKKIYGKSFRFTVFELGKW